MMDFPRNSIPNTENMSRTNQYQNHDYADCEEDGTPNAILETSAGGGTQSMLSNSQESLMSLGESNVELTQNTLTEETFRFDEMHVQSGTKAPSGRKKKKWTETEDLNISADEPPTPSARRTKRRCCESESALDSKKSEPSMDATASSFQEQRRMTADEHFGMYIARRLAAFGTREKAEACVRITQLLMNLENKF